MPTTYNYRSLKVVIYDAELLAQLNTPKGTLWHVLHSAGNAAVTAAKIQVGKKTGDLARSIHMKHLGNVMGQYLWIGSKHRLAYIHHEGTRRHVIEPDDGKILVFSRGARVIRTPRVTHPGTAPNRYLSDQLKFFKPIIRGI